MSFQKGKTQLIKELDEKKKLGIEWQIQEGGEAGNMAFKCIYTLGSLELGSGGWKTNKASAKEAAADAAWDKLYRLGYIR